MRWRFALAALVLVAVAVTLLRKVPAVRSFVRGETDWHGERVYEPHHPVATDEVDHARVHAELLPRWLIARSRRTRGVDMAAEAEAFAPLHEAVAPDQNLTALIDELHALSSPGALAQDPGRALYLSWAWSHYLDEHEVPFVVHGTVRGSKFGPIFSAAIYVVNANAQVGLGSQRYRVRLVSRIDGMNLREQYLGAASHHDAVLVVDRLREFALADVWPLLDPWLELRPPGRGNFAGPLRREARAQLSAEALAALRRTAGARWQITRTLRAMEARRMSCGSGFRINSVPWYGFDVERIERLDAVAERHAERYCPGITRGEVRALERASAQIDPDDVELQLALQELVAWTAQHVAIHEARHLADHHLVQGFDEPLPCASCSEGMGIAARAELSGYLASLAWSPSPALALYQACRSLAGEQRHLIAQGQPHREALQLLQRRVGPVCIDGPPDDLRGLARHLEVEMLGRSEVMALPADFPSRLPVE